MQAHDTRIHPLCLIFAIIRVLHSGKERAKEREREKKGKGEGVLELKEQERQAGMAMFFSQATTPVPGYLFIQTCLESLELQVSSRLFRLHAGTSGQCSKNGGCP